MLQWNMFFPYCGILTQQYSSVLSQTNQVIHINHTTAYKTHDDVIKWKHFPRNWPFVREIHRSPVNFPHKGQWRGALMFSLIYAWINDWVNNREAGDLRRQHGHYDVIVMHAYSQNIWPSCHVYPFISYILYILYYIFILYIIHGR